MEATVQREVDLHQKTSENLRKAGYHVTPQTLNPNDQSPLEVIRERLGEAVHVVGSQAEETLLGKGPQTHIGTTRGKRWAYSVLDRFKRKLWK